MIIEHTKLDSNNRGVMMAPTFVLPFHVPFLLSSFAICLVRFELALNPLENSSEFGDFES